MTRLPVCPWQMRPTHGRNGELQVDAWTPLAYGYCPVDADCASCAGTGYKPNILLNVGRPTSTVPCPHCAPEAYRKAVKRLLEADKRKR